jgi:hypothetical protein
MLAQMRSSQLLLHKAGSAPFNSSSSSDAIKLLVQQTLPAASFSGTGCQQITAMTTACSSSSKQRTRDLRRCCAACTQQALWAQRLPPCLPARISSKQQSCEPTTAAAAAAASLQALAAE